MIKYTKIFFFILSSLLTLSVWAVDEPLTISWKTLGDVNFNKKWNPSEGMFILEPEFGNSVKQLNGKMVKITGYMIPIDIETNYYVLSANPYAACFFCGGAGPESVLSIKFKKVTRRFDTDERLTISGKLVLNKDNLDELNYILTEAEVH
ncbi:DUF3299 domain-containing protein [Jiulongibacter sediminis]|jgi:hypothetical protein|uniref:DUF3299 domain-containing protein n=1 Tax=Jiulongibacter sediminis TaxID=1605367 RepID=A0A0P7CAP7_9BACT|nr:DUF3299 domain-containing protein [Jiulongibacter sediminis]KPM49747.1 hypothetical protein AFM12_03975 [Jiulongibacter sediminis]TBX26783.1 hypothetical protein TK44_03980 [Jiulongibacter sediminis]